VGDFFGGWWAKTHRLWLGGEYFVGGMDNRRPCVVVATNFDRGGNRRKVRTASQATRLRDVFKNNREWKQIIVSNGRGYYRLNLAETMTELEIAEK